MKESSSPKFFFNLAETLIKFQHNFGDAIVFGFLCALRQIIDLSNKPTQENSYEGEYSVSIPCCWEGLRWGGGWGFSPYMVVLPAKQTKATFICI